MTVGQEDSQAMAVAFCRECRGWEDAAIRKLHPERVASKERGAQFIYDDLEMVMWAAEIWVREKKLALRHYYDGPSGPYLHSVRIMSNNSILSLADGHDLCHCILVACVEAKRKLDAPSGSSGR